MSTPDRPLRLNCTRCKSFEEFDREQGETSVYCAECGKKHSANSLYPVDPHAEYERDEAGNLLNRFL